MKKKKLSLKDLNVRSFITNEASMTKGGETTAPPTGHLGNCDEFGTMLPIGCNNHTGGQRTYCTDDGPFTGGTTIIKPG